MTRSADDSMGALNAGKLRAAERRLAEGREESASVEPGIQEAGIEHVACAGGVDDVTLGNGGVQHLLRFGCAGGQRAVPSVLHDRHALAAARRELVERLACAFVSAFGGFGRKSGECARLAAVGEKHVAA